MINDIGFGFIWGVLTALVLVGVVYVVYSTGYWVTQTDMRLLKIESIIKYRLP